MSKSRLQGILDRVSEKRFSESRWLLGAGVLTNYAQSFVDETMKRNAEFQTKAGVAPKIVRKSPTKCCPWCDALVGEYRYPDEVPDDVYRRHDNCNCIVEYYPGDGRRQNVWSKSWAEADEETLERRRTVGLDDLPNAPTVKSDEAAYVEAAATRNGVARVPVADAIDPNTGEVLERTTEELVGRIGGGDMTGGSCASLSLAWAGNRAGYDVLDFRGGASQDTFSRSSILKKIRDLPGVKSFTARDYSDIKAVKALLGQMDDGREYILVTGRHAAVIKKTGSKAQYLELQSSIENGYKDLDAATLRSRFGAQKSHSTFGMKYEAESFIIDVESLGKNDDFAGILEFINTAADSQKKGVAGGLK